MISIFTKTKSHVFFFFWTINQLSGINTYIYCFFDKVPYVKLNFRNILGIKKDTLTVSFPRLRTNVFVFLFVCADKETFSAFFLTFGNDNKGHITLWSIDPKREFKNVLALKIFRIPKRLERIRGPSIKCGGWRKILAVLQTWF